MSMSYSSRTAKWTLWILRGWLLGAFLIVTMSDSLVYAAEVQSSAAANLSGKIILQDERMTARIIAIPLRQVMEEIGRLSGARVWWMSQGGEEPVSVAFLALPLSEALRRILGQKNF